MKKIIKILSKDKHYVNALVQFVDNGDSTLSTMTINEYEAFLLKEKLVSLGVKESDLETLEQLAYERGCENTGDPSY